MKTTPGTYTPVGSTDASSPSSFDSRQNLLAVLLDNTSDHIYFKDAECKFILISRSMADIFNLASPDEAIGKSDADFFTAEHASAALHDEQTLMKTGVPIENQVERETWPDGSVTWVSSTKMAMRNAAGEAIGTFGISRDISVQMRAQIALQESREQIASILSSITEGFIALDEKGFITYANPASETLLGSSSEDLNGLRVMDLFSDGVGKALVAIFRKAQTDEKFRDCEVFDDAGQRWLTFRAYPSAKGVSVFFRDITLRKKEQSAKEDQQRELEALVDERTRELTDANALLQHEIRERQRAEAALLQTERLEAISSMAGGMAANFENIVTIISQYATTILDTTTPGSHPHENAARVLEAAQRGHDLTQRLMGVAQIDTAGRASPVEPVDLAPVTSGTVQLVADLYRQKNISIVFAGREDMPYVMGDPEQLKDVLMALLMNAVEAMHADGGIIRIDILERTVFQPNRKRNPKAQPGKYAIVRIRDNGIGIKRENLGHIFEPFFTTKKESKYHGLGLAFARGAIQSMGGWVDVRSRPGKGSSFRIFMPKADAGPARERSSKHKGGAHVLVLDEAEDFRTLVTNCLGAAGYVVHGVGCPGQALDLLGAENGERIDIAIIDALMPNGSTEALLDMIGHARPGLKVVLVSGFSRTFVRGRVGPRKWTYLQKPCAPDQLLDSMNRLVTSEVDVR